MATRPHSTYIRVQLQPMTTTPVILSLPPSRQQSQRLLRRLPAALPSPSKQLRRPPSILVAARRRPGFCMRLEAVDGSQKVVVPRSVPVRAAHELLQAGHRYLDVRTVDEFSAGYPVGAINIPYMFKVGSGMTKNPNFLEEVSAVFEKDDEIIIGCQSGRRSLMAATDLSSAGFTGITDIAGGYTTWVQNRLPTNQ